MTKLTQALSTNQALILALALVGCSTAAVIAGHISSADFLAVVGGTGILGSTVATAHVVGTQVNTAASAAPQAPQTPPGVFLAAPAAPGAPTEPPGAPAGAVALVPTVLAHAPWPPGVNG